LEDIKKEHDEKIRAAFAGDAGMVKFMEQTLESFAHRYLATSTTPRPQVVQHSHSVSVMSLETSMVEALKTSDPITKDGIKDLARRVPRAEQPAVQYSLTTTWEELDSGRGKLKLEAMINWDFPTFQKDGPHKRAVDVVFHWSELGEFRKGYPLALEKVCDLFL
jgi:hypothetical protein